METQLTSKEIDSIDIYPYTEFLLDEYNDSIEKSQKYLKHYGKDISYLGDYIDNFMCFYYDYNQIEQLYKLLR